MPKSGLLISLFLFLFPPFSYSAVITDRNGREIKTFLSEGDLYSSPVKIEKVSPWVILASVAAEDKRFFEHSGVDYRAVVRALWQNAKSGKAVSGASTITQQLVKNMEKRSGRSFWSKLAELPRVFSLEKSSTKKEIMENYLNAIFYGNMSRGIEAAARRYFGVSAGELSLAQSALLSGIPQSPSKYNPAVNLTAAVKRQKLILRRMLDLGFIDEELYRMALSEKIVLADSRGYPASLHFVNRAARLFPGGEKLSVSIDAALNEEAREILNSHLSALSGSNVTNGAVLAVDNATGEILAWVGSSDFFDAARSGQVDGVTSLRQPGSALKPFLYALAFLKGSKPSDLIDDSPYFSAGKYKPRNYDESYHGPVSIRRALACSYNVPAVYMAEKLGADVFLNFLREFGFSSLSKNADFYGTGLALGNGEVTLLELVNAYSVLARGGVRLPVKYLKDGEEPGKAERIIPPEYAYMITDILSDNFARAPAFGLNSPLNLPFAFAAKTGTTKDYRDNWAVGYTPAWTVGAWVGNFNGEPMRKVSGISGAAPVVRDMAHLLNKIRPGGGFKKPKGLAEIEICPESGLLKSIRCPSGARELFHKRNAPSKICDLPHSGPGQEAAGFSPGSRLEFPKNGDVFKLDPQVPEKSQALLLKASVTVSAWNIDGKEYPGDSREFWLAPAPGEHKVYFYFQKGGKRVKSPTVKFLIIK